MAPHTINTTVADRRLLKNSCVALLQIVHLITSATNNDARVQMSTASWTCDQYVHHSPVRHPAGDTSTGWYCHQWTSVDSARHSSTIAWLFWWVGQGLICTKLCWKIPSESGESSSCFSTRVTRNAIMWFYPSKCTNAVIIQQCYFLWKQVVIRKILL